MGWKIDPGRIITDIYGVNYHMANGQMVIPPNDSKYAEVERVTYILEGLNVPYRRLWMKSHDGKHIHYRFVVDTDSEVRNGDIDTLKRIINSGR